MLKKLTLALFCGSSFFIAPNALADITLKMNVAEKNGLGKEVGHVVIKETKYGLLFTPQLKNVVPELNEGVHGFHLHENPSCANAGMAAGGHFDPSKSGKHLGPYNDEGHLGDLPAIYVEKNGDVTTPVLAPKLKLSDLKDHALMIHAGGDNYSDLPEKLGGGGMRMVCGVIK